VFKLRLKTTNSFEFFLERIWTIAGSYHIDKLSIQVLRSIFQAKVTERYKIITVGLVY